MSKKLMMITLRGNTKEWNFNFYEDPKYLKEWRADGLEVNQIDYVIPEWIVDLKLTRVWMVLQDLFNLKFW